MMPRKARTGTRVIHDYVDYTITGYKRTDKYGHAIYWASRGRHGTRPHKSIRLRADQFDVLQF